jgi:hypothetical protein
MSLTLERWKVTWLLFSFVAAASSLQRISVKRPLETPRFEKLASETEYPSRELAFK